MNKQILRSEIKEKRNALLIDFVREKSKKTEENIIKSELYKNSKVIALYMSIKNEVDLSGLIKKAFNDKKRVLVPVTEGEDIYFCEIFPDSEVLEESFKILVPKKKIRVEKNTPDLCFVPGIVFDKKGARIGWGRGYYDKLLENTSFDKVGVCYDFQVMEKIETQGHDIKMDYLITESELINCGEGL